MLEKYKKENHLTNKALAEMLGVTQITVWRILNEHRVGRKSIEAMSKLLNVEEIEIYEYYKSR